MQLKMKIEIIVSITIAIIGWVVVHVFSVRRERKKEWREFARETVKYIEAIEYRSIEYHIGEKRNFELEIEIKNTIDFLEVRINLIKKNLKFIYDISYFRAAITLNNFETSAFAKQQRFSPLLQDVAWRAKELKEALYMAE